MQIIIVDEHASVHPALLQAITVFVTTREAMLRSLVELEERMMPNPTEGNYPDGYGDWRDFIPNPTRPKQKGRAYKAPKQSFRAQMRSVNRNR